MKRKFLILFVCSFILVFAFSITAFAYGFIPPNGSPGMENYNIIPQEAHQLRDVQATLGVLNDGYSVVTFSINYYTIDYEGFFESEYQTFSEYMGWYQLQNTEGSWLYALINYDTYTYSNWYEFQLTLNEALGYAREYYFLQLDYSVLEQDVEYYVDEIEQLETRISQLENELVNGGTWNDGYNAGLNDSQSISEGLITLFTAPVTFLQGWFNFEIFGINFVNIIKFFVSVALVGWLFKRLREE